MEVHRARRLLPHVLADERQSVFGHALHLVQHREYLRPGVLVLDELGLEAHESASSGRAVSPPAWPCGHAVEPPAHEVEGAHGAADLTGPTSGRSSTSSPRPKRPVAAARLRMDFEFRRPMRTATLVAPRTDNRNENRNVRPQGGRPQTAPPKRGKQSVPERPRRHPCPCGVWVPPGECRGSRLTLHAVFLAYANSIAISSLTRSEMCWARVELDSAASYVYHTYILTLMEV